MKKRNAVLLDLGGVVFQSRGISNDIINWDIISTLNEKYGTGMDLGGDTFPLFLEEYNELTKQELNREEFLKNVFDTLIFNEELIDAIRKDRDIIIVSDNYRENINYISKRYDFKRWSVKQIYSFEYKMYKSNPAFFKKLLKEIEGYDIKELILIDDSESKLESANLNGIKGILYRDNKQTIKEFEKHIQ